MRPFKIPDDVDANELEVRDPTGSQKSLHLLMPLQAGSIIDLDDLSIPRLDQVVPRALYTELALGQSVAKIHELAAQIYATEAPNGAPLAPEREDLKEHLGEVMALLRVAQRIDPTIQLDPIIIDLYKAGQLAGKVEVFFYLLGSDLGDLKVDRRLAQRWYEGKSWEWRSGPLVGPVPWQAHAQAGQP